MHTRWIVKRDADGLYNVFTRSGVGVAFHIVDRKTARLIAVAPVLLSAAKQALACAESRIHDELDGTGLLLEAALAQLEPVRSAIKKAEG